MSQRQPFIKAEHWEDDEFVITIDGKPVGQTMHLRDAAFILRWLPTALADIQALPPDRPLYILEPGVDH